MSDKYLFKMEFNPNNFPQIDNLQKFYLDAFNKAYDLYQQNLISFLDPSSIQSLKQLEPDTGFLYSKKEIQSVSRSQQQKGGLDRVIRKLNLKIWSNSSSSGKVVNYSDIKFLIGVKPDSNIFVRVVSIQKDSQCSKQELQSYYLVHIYKYEQDISRAQIQLINQYNLKEKQSSQEKMEEEIQQTNMVNIKQEFFEQQQEQNENLKQKNKVDQLENQVYEMAERNTQLNSCINILMSKISILENQVKEIMKNQNVIILD